MPIDVVELQVPTAPDTMEIQVPGPQGAQGPDGPIRPKDEIRSSVDAGFNYVGIAPLDTPEASAVWTITRIALNGAVGTTATATNTAWTNRLGGTYS